MVNFRFARAGSSADRSSASTAEESRAAGSNQNQRGALSRGGGEGAARGHGRGGGGVAAAGSNSSRGNSSISVARAASSSSSSSVPPNEEEGGQEDIQNSRQRRLGPGSARTAKRKVLRLLDSPRRVIMSARRQQGGGGSGIGGGNAPNDMGHSNAATAQPFPEGGAAAASPASSMMVPALGGGNGRQVSPHYSHFRLDGVSTRAMLKAARARSQEQQQLQLRGNDVDLPAGSGPSAFGGGRAGGTFPSQETAATASSSLEAIPSSSTRTKSDVFIERGSQHDVLSWLHDEAPQDILPRVLSFAGSRRIDALSRTCKSWRTLTLSEPVWRTACEDTGKWRPGVDGPVTGSWLQHYVDNPIVPTDYGTIEAAFHANNEDGGDRESRNPFPARDGGRHASSAVREHHRSIRVLLRPDRYVIRDALVVHAVADAEVTIETVEPPVRPSFRGANEDEKEAGGTAPLASSGGRRGVLSTARDMLTCRSSSAAANDGRAGDAVNDNNNNVGHEDEDDPMDDYSDSLSPSRPSSARANLQPSQSSRGGSGGGTSSPRPSPPRRAVLVLKTRRPNEPIVRVRQGTVRLSKLDLVHNAAGTDIWNGNAAVQVQPPFDENDHPVRAVPPSRPPTAVLDSVDITSISGRGVVTIDGGYATVRNCHIHDCAATGIYIGGPGSVATIENTDVLENGNGNLRSRRGIARGHSGVYLEQGVATLRDCNVSRNSLTGISAISADNATLEIEDSDLVSNGSIQLEMPPAGSASRRRSVSRNNRMAAMGMGRSRSGLVPEEEGRRGGDGNSPAESSPSRDDRPQSPLADASPPPLPHARNGGLPVRGLPAAANFFY